MDKRTARALGRFCEKHQQKHCRVPLPTGEGWATGCSDCLTSPEMARALTELVEAAYRHAHEQ
jgi:hypothetical protein